MKIRDDHDYILLSIIPHMFTIYFTYDDLIYTTIIISATLSSYIWHKKYEPTNYLLLLDYFFAGVLSVYETIDTYKYNNKLLNLSICLNLSVLLFNKSVIILSKYKIIKYNKFHSIYHLFSAFKTIIIAYLTSGIRIKFLNYKYILKIFKISFLYLSYFQKSISMF